MKPKRKTEFTKIFVLAVTVAAESFCHQYNHDCLTYFRGSKGLKSLRLREKNISNKQNPHLSPQRTTTKVTSTRFTASLVLLKDRITHLFFSIPCTLTTFSHKRPRHRFFLLVDATSCNLKIDGSISFLLPYNYCNYEGKKTEWHCGIRTQAIKYHKPTLCSLHHG